MSDKHPSQDPSAVTPRLAARSQWRPTAGAPFGPGAAAVVGSNNLPATRPVVSPDALRRAGLFSVHADVSLSRRAWDGAAQRVDGGCSCESSRPMIRAAVSAELSGGRAEERRRDNPCGISSFSLGASFVVDAFS